jgi:hypothetical protein
MKLTNLKKSFILVLLLIPLTISDCKKEKEEPTLDDFYVLNVQAESDWDYWVIGKEGGNFLIQMQGSKLSTIYYKPLPDQDGYPIFMDDNGLPSKVVIQDHIFLFGNIRKSLTDISVILPNGEIVVYRDVQVDYDLTSGLTNGEKNLQDISDIIKFSARIVGTVSCAVGIAAAAPTGGLSLTLAWVGCGSFFVGWIADLLPESTITKVTGLSAFTVGTITKAVGCATGSVVTCGLAITSQALSVTGEIAEDIENNNDKINLASSQLKLYEAKNSLSVPTIDGQINQTEWSNANSYSITFTRPDGMELKSGKLLLQHDGTWLYVGVNTEIKSGWDVYLCLKFDGNHDHILSGNSSLPHVDINVEYPSPGGWTGYIRYDYLVGSNANPITAPTGTLRKSYGSTSVSYEYKIKLSDLSTSSGKTIGFYMFNYNYPMTGIGHVYEYDLANHGYEFPIKLVMNDPSKWVDIKLN